MSLFNKFRDRLKKVAEQGEEMVRDQKTRFDLSSVRRKQSDLFARMGEEIYKRELKNQAYDDIVRNYLDELRELDREIAEREAAAREGREPDTGAGEIDIELTTDEPEEEFEPIDIELGDQRQLQPAPDPRPAEETEDGDNPPPDKEVRA